MADSKMSGTEHKLVLLNQEQMDLIGVSRVESFNPEEILLETSHGLLNIKGEGLDMKNLNLERGVVEIVGLVTEIRYSGEKSAGRRSILDKIFK
ncbi:MAG: sporulation protein YabP [Eubacteriales bacterium]|jgi:sporulation protein YabP|nr:sporulation protein YabP [Eubacteriales bacterium]